MIEMNEEENRLFNQAGEEIYRGLQFSIDSFRQECGREPTEEEKYQLYMGIVEYAINLPEYKKLKDYFRRDAIAKREAGVPI